MDKNGHLLVHRVGTEEEVALVAEVPLLVLVPEALEAAPASLAARTGSPTCPAAVQLIIMSSSHCLACV
jgi:hypothetical protein